MRRTISLALRDAGVVRPYPLEDRDGMTPMDTVLESNDELAEFEWAFGDDADERMEKLALEVAGKVADGDIDKKVLLKMLSSMRHGDVSVCLMKMNFLTDLRCICQK